MLSVDRVGDRRSWAILTRIFSGKRSAGQKAVEKTGKERPWKSLRDFHFSHSFNNNKLDDRDHFLENATASVASLRRLIGSTRNTDRDQIGMLIGFVGIPTTL
jgi:hypothetical protein